MMSGFYEDFLRPEQERAAQQQSAGGGGSASGGGGGLFGGLFVRSKLDLRAFIAQMGTGEGKSIVIAMLAIFLVQLHGVRVHILENNEGLLDRDYATNAPLCAAAAIDPPTSRPRACRAPRRASPPPLATAARPPRTPRPPRACLFLGPGGSRIYACLLARFRPRSFASFGIRCGIDLMDETAEVVYCLKKSINTLFIRKMLDGKLDETLGQTVVIVDEVDDLVVNENPNANYVKEDAERTPDLRKCFAALKRDEKLSFLRGVEVRIWEQAKEAVREANSRVEGRDYRLVVEGGRQLAVILVNGVIPQVRRAAMWLSYLNYKLSGAQPIAESPFATVCTPYVFNKYAAIFGLSGSVGGQAELHYLASTYGAVKFEVPRFLDTCTGDTTKVVTNHGVELVAGEAALVARVVELCRRWVRLVPVLVITSGTAEQLKVYAALREAEGIVADEVQRFARFDESGNSLKDQWETIIADATKRFGGPSDNRCRVTVTDQFGGRGHDYNVMDKAANANGGMLVIATSVPDEREWIQWRGRTARQDRPGQYHVVLNRQAPPFTDHPGLAESVGGLSVPEERLARLLQVQDETIGATLKKYERDQELGENVNELAEAYFRLHPRAYDEPWPSVRHRTSDLQLRALLEQLNASKGSSVKDFQRMAKEKLGIEFADDQTKFKMADLAFWKEKRQGEMAEQVGAA